MTDAHTDGAPDEPASSDSPEDAVFDPFDRRRSLPSGVVFVDDDLDDPGRFVAWRIGAPESRGYGKTQVEAIRDLERLESTRPPTDEGATGTT